jgi:hypothetical protein
VVVKNLATSTQETISRSGLVAHLRALAHTESAAPIRP